MTGRKGATTAPRTRAPAGGFPAPRRPSGKRARERVPGPQHRTLGPLRA